MFQPDLNLRSTSPPHMIRILAAVLVSQKNPDKFKRGDVNIRQE